MNFRLPAYRLFLPTTDPADPCPDTRWRVTYEDQYGMTFNTEVCAPDEETAVMRAGMKRAEEFRLNQALFPDLARQRQWQRTNVEIVN